MKFGDIMKKIGNVASGAFLGVPLFTDAPTAPILPSGTSNKIVAAISSIEHLTSTIESMKGMAGAEKLAAAASMSKDAILLSSVLANAEVEDQARFDLGVSKITDGWNDVIKSVKKK
jgi:hypothetical protein